MAEQIQEYLDVVGSKISWELIRIGWASIAVFAFAPMQDNLNLKTHSRMNYPSRIGGNRDWRMPDNY